MPIHNAEFNYKPSSFALHRRRESVTAQEVIDQIMATSRNGLAIFEINKALDFICRKE